MTYEFNNSQAVWREPDSACRHADQTISSPRDRNLQFYEGLACSR